MRITHGHCIGEDSGAYKSWIAMRQRCNNPNNTQYAYYGGRGITICERWDSFENFLADMGERPDGLTLEREDTNGPYEPNNCRWATRTEQARNTRQTRLSLRVAHQIKWLVEMGYSWAHVARMFSVEKWTVQSLIRGDCWREA